MEGINKITARIIEDAEREIALMQQENEDKINFVYDRHDRFFAAAEHIRNILIRCCKLVICPVISK